MKSSFRCFLIVAASIAAMSSGAAEPPMGDAPATADMTWKTLAASGPVEARAIIGTETVWDRVTRGDELEPRTVVRTGRRGRATLAQQASVLMVDPHSELELPYTVSPDGPSSVTQTTGSVVYEVDGEKVDDFKVVTPYLIAGVKGTTFLVSVTDRYAAVTVEHGVVEVTSLLSGESRDVHAGETLKVDTVEEDAVIEVVSLDSDRHELNRDTVRFARDEFRRLNRMVEDSVLAVQTNGTAFGYRRDLLGAADSAPAAGDPAEINDVASSVSEWSQDAIHREALRETPDGTSPGGNSN